MARSTLTIAFLFGASGVASASPAAEKLFQDGRAALANKELDKACEAFRASEELEPRVGTLLNLGDCEQQRARVASAWSAFGDARDLAIKLHDARAAAAEQRAKVLEPRLPYVKLVVTQVPGIVVQRDGVDVVAAEWDREVPIDPRTYEMSASAPGYQSWSARIVIVEGQHVPIVVPELVKVAAAAIVPPESHDTHVETVVVAPPIVPIVPIEARPSVPYHIAIGVLSGSNDSTKWVNGARVVLNAAPVAGGMLRIVPEYRHVANDGRDGVDQQLHENSLGGTLEYAYPVTNRLLVAGGIGGGVDFEYNSYQTPTDATFGWGCIRLSPTFTFDRLNVGLHYELVRRSDGFVSLFEAGIDFFVW